MFFTDYIPLMPF